jgi:hypothetical protein
MHTRRRCCGCVFSRTTIDVSLRWIVLVRCDCTSVIASDCWAALLLLHIRCWMAPVVKSRFVVCSFSIHTRIITTFSIGVQRVASTFATKHIKQQHSQQHSQQQQQQQQQRCNAGRLESVGRRGRPVRIRDATPLPRHQFGARSRRTATLLCMFIVCCCCC